MRSQQSFYNPRLPTGNNNVSAAPKPRPKYFEFNLAHHWPPAVLSILHRICGALLFFPLLPLALWILQSTLGTAEGYGRWREFFADPVVKGKPVRSYGAFAFRPEDKELLAAFNRKLAAFQKTPDYVRILAHYGLSRHSIDAARAADTAELCAPD